MAEVGGCCAVEGTRKDSVDGWEVQEMRWAVWVEDEEDGWQ